MVFPLFFLYNKDVIIEPPPGQGAKYTAECWEKINLSFLRDMPGERTPCLHEGVSAGRVPQWENALRHGKSGRPRSTREGNKMKKRILSLCMVLVLCLSLLPATVLAADGDTVYVGGVALIGSTGSPAYATTDDSGAVITGSASESDYNIKWDGSTLTLKEAYITQAVSTPNYSSPVEGAAIGVATESGNAALTVKLEGDNTIEDVTLGIRVYSPSSGTASLTIMGDGSLDARSIWKGISVQSNNSDAALTIRNAKVEVTVTSVVGYGVLVQAGGSSNASLTVDGGSLTATGNGSTGSGIYFQFGSDTSSGKPTVTVSDNAIVKASGGSGGITTSNSGSVTPSGTGIVFDSGTGTVYGNVTLQDNLEIGEGESLDIPNAASLTIPNNITLTNEGTVTNSGTLTNNGKIENSGTLPGNIDGTAPPSITTTSPLTDGTVGTGYSATLAAMGNPTLWTWSASTGRTLPNGLTLNESTGTISGNPTTAGTYNFTVKATNSGGSDSEQLSITISPAATVSVTGVSLNTSTLNLTEGSTDTLTATVEPANADNRAVTWESSNSDIATVDTSGKVTAVSAGTATITVKTVDGSFTDTCSVTVKHGSLTHTPKKDAACMADGNEEYWTCGTCGKHFIDAEGNTEIDLADTVISKLGHSYGEPVLNWSEDGKSCTVTFICANDETHNATLQATITSEVKTAASCTGKGVTEYTAAAEFDGTTYTDTKDVADIPVTDHHYENGRCSVCGAIDNGFDPVITAGAGGTWQKGAKDGLSFTSNAAFADFVKVQVDGRDLAVSDYEVKESSTVVTLKTSYLETLSVGKHTLAIVSDTSTATTDFTIQAAPATGGETQPPQTGDNNNIALWIVILLASAGALGLAVYGKRERQ